MTKPLTDNERASLDDALVDSGCHGFQGDHPDLYAAAERIIAARTAEVARILTETRTNEDRATGHQRNSHTAEDRNYWQGCADAFGIVGRHLTSALGVRGE